MSCPTCDHTMHAMGGSVFWCPRCGTVRASVLIHEPKLVWRVRELKVAMETAGKESVLAEMRRLGVLESVE